MNTEKNPISDPRPSVRTKFLARFLTCGGILGVIVAFSLAGCTIAREQVAIAPHKASATISSVAGAASVRIRVEVPPVTEKNTIQLSLWGVANQTITLDGTTVSDAVRQAFEAELVQRGFVLDKDQGLVKFTVQ